RVRLYVFVLVPPSPRATPVPYTTLFRSCDAHPRRVGQRRARAWRGPSAWALVARGKGRGDGAFLGRGAVGAGGYDGDRSGCRRADRKSTRLNSSHVKISYAVFCLKKKKK